MPKAVKFREWILEEVLPSIRKHGSYSIQEENKFTKESFYDTNMISEFNNKSVVYIGYIGKHNNEYIFNI